MRRGRTRNLELRSSSEKCAQGAGAGAGAGISWVPSFSAGIVESSKGAEIRRDQKLLCLKAVLYCCCARALRLLCLQMSSGIHSRWKRLLRVRGGLETRCVMWQTETPDAEKKKNETTPKNSPFYLLFFSRNHPPIRIDRYSKAYII